MAEMRIGVANGGMVVNGVSGMGTGATVQAAGSPAAPATPAGALVGAVEAGVTPQAAQAPAQAPAAPAAAPATPAPAQAAWQATPPAAAAPVAPVQPIAASPQAAPYSPPVAAAPPPSSYAASNAVLTPSSADEDTSTTLSSSSAAAIAVPLTVVACAILLLAGLIWWYKRHPPRGSRSLSLRRGHRERDEMSISEKALVIPGYESRSGSVRSVASTAVSSRGVTVTPHIETPVVTRPPPSVAPSIASIRRPTSMNIQKPLPPISEYGGSSVSSSSSSGSTQSTVPVIHSATVGRRTDARLYSSPRTRSVHPTIPEEAEAMSYDSEADVSTAPSSPRTQIRAAQRNNYFSTSRMTASSVGSPLPRRSGPPAASVYSTHSAPLPRSKRSGPARRPIPVEAYSYAQSLPASIARNAPASTVRRSPAALPALGHSPQSSCESESLPEMVDFPAEHPFARKYAGSSASGSSRARDRPYESDDTESMMRSITAGTELTLPWGFAETKAPGKKYEDGVEPLRKPEKGDVKLFREETRKGADWARERSF